MPILSVSAQQDMYVLENDGKLNVINVSSINYATFNANGDWFTINNGEIESATKYSVTASCSVSLKTNADIKSLSTQPEVGVCYSDSKPIPSIEDDCQTLGSTFKDYSFTVSRLHLGSTYYFRIYIKLSNSVFYGSVFQAKTLGTRPANKTINGHSFVDLGLPSGLLWATCNIGATSAVDFGDRFAWGETSPKATYSEENYKFGNESMDKYNETDGKTILDNKDDAAYVNWGSACRIPTKADLIELVNSDNCTWEETSVTISSNETVRGYKFTSVRNGNSIFFPTSGNGQYELYWLSQIYPGSAYEYKHACYIYWRGDTMQYTAPSLRSFGHLVRPVAEP